MKVSLKDLKQRSNNIKYINNALIINNKVYKKKSSRKVYDYLLSKGFDYVLIPDITNNNIDEFNYIEDESISDSDKAIDLMYILSSLQNKTTSYKNISLDKIKEIYEEIINKIKDLYEYYYSYQDMIESKVYFNPSEYFLMINISLIYDSLRASKEMIDKYYEIISDKKAVREVFIHGKLELSHFINGYKKFLISIKEIKKDLPIYDFIYFYKKHYKVLDMNDLFNIYQRHFEYSDDELLLLFSNLLIIDKIVIKDSTYETYEKVKEMVEYLNITKEFILNQNKKYKENKQKEFQEK